MSKYFQNLSVATSCLVNALLGGKRYEMLSSRAYRANWDIVRDLLDLVFGDNHCELCYRFERDRFDGIQD